jgi:hypothetical protein
MTRINSHNELIIIYWRIYECDNNDSPEAQLGQASRRSNLGQIATPTDRIVEAFNARID